MTAWLRLFETFQIFSLLISRGAVNSFGAQFLCGHIPSLTEKQRAICQTSPDVIPVVGDGTQMGIAECQHQFKFSRWNCTPTYGHEQTFPHLHIIGSREAAYLYAITSSGVTYAITQACSRGEIASCGCAPSTTYPSAGTSQNLGANDPNSLDGGSWPSPAATWRWGGCSANVEFGLRFARKFIDAREIEGDARSLMNLHNNKAGRKMVQATVETECKCHGVSGSCTLKTCWLKLPSFRKIGDKLLKKYDEAKPVLAVPGQQGQRSRRSLVLLIRPKSSMRRLSALKPSHLRHVGKKIRERKRSLEGHGAVQKSKPRRSELVYLEPSPNYCEEDNRLGSLGTRGRHCLREGRSSGNTSQGRGNRESCDMLCCGRGHSTHQVTRKWKCGCKFRWCCEVECQNCQERMELYMCN